MRDLLQRLVAGTILILAADIAGAAEHLMGTWHMDPAQSHFNPGPGPQAFKRVFKAIGDAIDMEFTGVAPDGKTPFSGHAVFKLDGKDYPITGAANADTMAVKRVDTNRYETTMKKEGKVVGIVTSTISEDGRIFAQVIRSIDATGASTASTMVLHKQP